MPDSRIAENRPVDVVTAAGVSRAEVRQLAGALASATAVGRLHPVLRALAAELSAEAGGPSEVGGDGVAVGSAEVRDLRVEPAPGTGLGGVVRTAHSGLLLGRRVLLGGAAWLAAQGAGPAEGELARAYAAAGAAGTPAVLLAWSGTPRAVLTLRP